MKPVKWGIISTANIGIEKVIPGMMKSPEIEVAAIASRNLRKARTAAMELGVARSYGSYEELLADPEIEAVYNPLPNHLHVPLSLAAARAGKHVLCEKPIAITAREAAQLRKAPRGIHIAEAFMVRHASQWIEVRRRIGKGEIGDVRMINVVFAYFNRDPKNVRNQADIGGGGLLDIGCYPITVSRFIYGAEPRAVTAAFDRDPKFHTDRSAGGLADFGGGRHLAFSISTQTAPFQRVQILGTKGRIEIEIPFNAPPDRPNRFFVQGMAMNEGTWFEMPASDQYQLQAEAFGLVIRGRQKPQWGVADAIQNMKIIDAFFRSEKSRKWEKP